MSIGFIGMGNMAQAMAAGFIYSGTIAGTDVYAFAPHQDTPQAHAGKIGCVPAPTVKALVQSGDTVIIACKPYQIEEVLKGAATDLEGKALVSVAAGWGYDNYEAILGKKVRIQCIMPNTPSMVGEGVLLFENKNSLTDNEKSEIIDLFSCLGLVEEIPSELMGIGGAISGCGPAFMDMIMESYADAAVKYGIPRTLAYKLIAQTMLGSAKLELQSGSHPGALKDAVCSAGVTTIRCVAALEPSHVRGGCIECIDAIVNK